MSSETTSSKGNSPSPVAHRPRRTTPATVRYFDRTDVTRLLPIRSPAIVFDDQTLRIKFGVTRLVDFATGSRQVSREASLPDCKRCGDPTF